MADVDDMPPPVQQEVMGGEEGEVVPEVPEKYDNLTQEQQDEIQLDVEHKQQVYLLVDGFHLLQMLQNYIMVQVGQQTQQLQILENMLQEVRVHKQQL